MHLLGWHNPLPQFIVEAVSRGELTIHKVTDRKYGEYEVLKGSVTSPHGFIIEYQ